MDKAIQVADALVVLVRAGCHEEVERTVKKQLTRLSAVEQYRPGTGTLAAAARDAVCGERMAADFCRLGLAQCCQGIAAVTSQRASPSKLVDISGAASLVVDDWGLPGDSELLRKCLLYKAGDVTAEECLGGHNTVSAAFLAVLDSWVLAALSRGHEHHDFKRHTVAALHDTLTVRGRIHFRDPTLTHLFLELGRAAEAALDATLACPTQAREWGLCLLRQRCLTAEAVVLAVGTSRDRKQHKRVRRTLDLSASQPASRRAVPGTLPVYVDQRVHCEQCDQH
jgi:hypothetical protein